MIEIFRQLSDSIYMRFDDKGNEALIKAFDEILAGKEEVILDVAFDMSVVKMKRKTASQRASTIHVIKDNEIDYSTIYLQDNKIIWKIDAEDAEDAVYDFKQWKEQGWGVGDIFMWIKIPKNKTTDNMYCELVPSDDDGMGPSIDFPLGRDSCF